jgi:hypothetical protein
MAPMSSELPGDATHVEQPRGMHPAARWRVPLWLESLGAALVGMAAMTFVQAATRYVSGNDSYYHLRMARMLPDVGFIRQFPWLHWTIFRDDFVSHHHGFHVLLVPFVWLSERLTGQGFLGGKAAAVLAMGITAALFNALLRRLRVPHRWAWVLALACLPWHFWLRHSFIRAPMAALPLMLAALGLVLRRRQVALAVLGFVFVHVYGGAVVFLLIPLAAAAADFALGRGWRTILAPLVAASVGLAAGLVIHPYFPANLRFMYTQLFETGLGAPAESGVEWRPFVTMFFLRIAWPLLALWVGCAVWRVIRGGRVRRVEMTLLLVNLAFFALTCKSRRFIEYWPVFCLLHAAYLHARARRLRWAWSRGLRIGCGAAAAIALALYGLGNLLHARVEAQPGANVPAIRRAMNFMKERSPAGTLVLTDDWDIFPYCFYYNQHNHFAVGLDPVFTSGPYPALWARYRAITRGQTPVSLPADVIDVPDAGPAHITLEDVAAEFHAAYLLVCDDHPRLRAQLDERPDLFTLIFPPRDQAGAAYSHAVRIYEVAPRQQPGTPIAE